jgi:PhzF family phenazine biosynthesis protein
MSTRRFLQLDVFSPRAGAGNPLAVVLDAEGLDDASMQAIARWTRLPETTFVFPPQVAGASYRLRMFSPQKEVPFAGHPSVGTAHAVLQAGLAAPVDGVLVQDGIAGALPLRVSGEGAAAHRHPHPRAQLAGDAEATDPRLQAALKDWPLGTLPPARMQGGRSWWVVQVADEAALRALRPDWDAVAALAESTDSMGVFAYAFSDGGEGFDLAVRAFVGNGRRFEDAASGAANAVLAAWLDLRDALPRGRAPFEVSQGREVGHDARLTLRVDEDGEVWSGGQVQTVITGTLDW